MAAAGTGIEVLGETELRATLARAGDDLDDLTGSHTESAQVVATGARARAPKRSGRLAGSVRGTGAPTVATIGSDLIYAGPIHNGWPGHNIAAQPFITETVESSESVVLSIHTHAVEKILDRVHGV